MKEHKANCKEVMNHICDHLGEDLDSPKCTAIKEHLDSCENCRTYFKSVENTIEFYKKYDVKVDNQTHDRLISFLGLKEEN